MALRYSRASCAYIINGCYTISNGEIPTEVSPKIASTKDFSEPGKGDVSFHNSQKTITLQTEDKSGIHSNRKSWRLD